MFHYLNGGIRLQSPFQRVTPQVKVHLSVLLGLMALTKTYQYYLAQFALTKSRNGFVDGATYTDVHAHLPALRLLIVISIAAAGLFIVNIWRRGWVFPIIAVGLWGFISIVVGHDLPRGDPEVPGAAERALARNSRTSPATSRRRATRSVSRNITTKTFNYDLDAEHGGHGRGEADARQRAALRPAARAGRVQAARKRSRRSTRSPMSTSIATRSATRARSRSLASVRELDLAHLPDNSWTNQHLVYTHGYGAVAAAANEVNTDAADYVLQGIPPTGDLEPLDPKYTGVYFGEGASAGTRSSTPRSPSKKRRAAGSHQGHDVHRARRASRSRASLRKAALALRFGDWNLLVSGR